MLTMETPEQYAKSTQINNKETGRTSMTLLAHCSGASILDFEHVNAGFVWANVSKKAFSKNF